MMIHGILTVARALASPREHGEDRIGVFEYGDALVVVVADGSGGLSGGARAAELLVELVREAVAAPALGPLRAEAWVDLLARADLLLEADHDAGETTAVVLAVAERLVIGASCGDSGAWVVHPNGLIDDLTARQYRRLRLGSGRGGPSRSRGRGSAGRSWSPPTGSSTMPGLRRSARSHNRKTSTEPR